MLVLLRSQARQRHVLEGDRFARTDGGIGDPVRPHVVHLEQQAVREAALQRGLQRIEVVVAVVGLEAEGAEAGQRPLAGRRIDQVHGVLAEQVMPLAADVGDLADEIVPQLLLHHEIPVVVGEILAVTVDRLRAEELILRIEERHQRIRQRRKIGGRERIARHGALRRIAEIVVLIAAVVDAEAAADGGLAVEDRRAPRPGRCAVRSPSCWDRSKACPWGRSRRSPAISTTADRFRISCDYRVVFVPQSEVQSEVRSHLEFILRIALIEGAPVADHAFALQIGRG